MQSLSHQRLLSQFLSTSKSLEMAIKEMLSETPINHTEFRLLRLLKEKEEMPIIALRKEVSLASSSGTYIIDRLLNKGLVKRERRASDRRFYSVSLTEEGRRVIESTLPIYEEVIASFFGPLNEEEQEQFLRYLSALSSFENK